jgi:hypothetical protein
MSTSQHVLELLSRLSEAEKVFSKAKAELVDVQKKLNGIPYMPSHATNNNTMTNVSNVKRGRGRPKKNKPAVEVLTSNTSDEFSSTETVELERDVSCDCVDVDDAFNDATYTFINERIYIETKFGNYHDVTTKELCGWYNPYNSVHEWL